MKKEFFKLTVLCVFCLSLFFQMSTVIADNTGNLNYQTGESDVVAESFMAILKQTPTPTPEPTPFFPERPEEGYFPNLPDERSIGKRSILTLGSFATNVEPVLSTEIDTKCSIITAIKQQFVFSTSEKVYVGIAVRNSTSNSKNLKVTFDVTGPLVFKEVLNISVPAESICLPFTNLPKEVPEGLYKIKGSISGRESKDMIIEFRDNIPVGTSTVVP